ncbi:MAG: ribosomal protein S18-alanine N-acetyltransferase [Betaproteobacteria bacterium]
MSALPPGAAGPRAFRPMVQEDLDRVMEVEVHAYSFPWSRGNFQDSLASGYVAELMESATAALLGYYVAMPGVDELHLLNITVAPDFQRFGLGRVLLDRVEAQAQGRGFDNIWLEVRASNTRARYLYGARGFVEQGVRRGYYPSGGSRREDAVVMQLNLAQEPPDAAG